MSRIEWPEGFKDELCPDCGCQKFLDGPEGGMCTNIECVGCGSTFNVTPMGIQRLTRGQAHACRACRIKKAARPLIEYWDNLSRDIPPEILQVLREEVEREGKTPARDLEHHF